MKRYKSAYSKHSVSVAKFITILVGTCVSSTRLFWWNSFWGSFLLVIIAIQPTRLGSLRKLQNVKILYARAWVWIACSFDARAQGVEGENVLFAQYVLLCSDRCCFSAIPCVSSFQWFLVPSWRVGFFSADRHPSMNIGVFFLATVVTGVSDVRGLFKKSPDYRFQK